MTRRLLLLPLLLSPCLLSQAQQPTLPEADRIRIAEAFRLAEALQEAVWTGWESAPFAVLLVTPEHEFLVRHPHPSEQFTRAAYDSLLQSDVYVRPRVFSPNMLATFPADSGVPTIVVGLPENTGRASTRWVITVLHEHFHQLQYAQPDYYPATEALDLARHDSTGMWMLNYPFPYDSTAVVKPFAALNHAAREALRAVDTPRFTDQLDAFRQARQHLRQILSDADYRYLSFQLWQEGVARYTEYKVATAAAAHYQPSAAFRALDDYEPFDEAARAIYDGILNELTDGSLDQNRRVTFYALGAAEALLLDQARPGWHARYFEEKFYLENYFLER